MNLNMKSKSLSNTTHLVFSLLCHPSIFVPWSFDPSVCHLSATESDKRWVLHRMVTSLHSYGMASYDCHGDGI